jgi:hypothetical protein
MFDLQPNEVVNVIEGEQRHENFLVTFGLWKGRQSI